MHSLINFLRPIFTGFMMDKEKRMLSFLSETSDNLPKPFSESVEKSSKNSGLIIFHPAKENSVPQFQKRHICLKNGQSMGIFRFDALDHFKKLADESNLVFFCPKLSRRHATLIYFDNDFYITDHSLNGTSITYLEGTKLLLEKNKKYVLNSGDLLHFGDHCVDGINTIIEIVGSPQKGQKRKIVSEKFGAAKVIRIEGSSSKFNKIVSTNFKPLKECNDATKVNYSPLENLPNEILLQIFENINPSIKKLISLSHVCRRMRVVAHDQRLWENVNLFPTSQSAGLLQMILENGCKKLQACSQIVGTLTLNEESDLEFFSTWHTDHRILNVLLKSCYSLKELHLNSVILTQDMISSICNQNCKTLKILKLAEWSSNNTRYVPTEWIQLIIDNCCELTLLDLSNTNIKEESIEYVAEHLTPKISKLWLTGIKSDDKCLQIIKILENRCNNLNELQMFQFRIRSGTIYGIGSHSKIGAEEQAYLKNMRHIISTFRHYE